MFTSANEYERNHTNSLSDEPMCHKSAKEKSTALRGGWPVHAVFGVAMVLFITDAVACNYESSVSDETIYHLPFSQPITLKANQMMNEAEQLSQAWQTNCRINRLLVETVSADGWLCTLSKRGGRGVAGEFAHMHNVRLSHLQKRAKDLSVDVPKLDPSSQPDKGKILAAFDASDSAIEALLLGVLENEPKRRGFRKGIFTTLSYFIAHEAHHRGRILLTLKVSGETLDRNMQMNIWGWDQL